jgi:hypothetical protein
VPAGDPLARAADAGDGAVLDHQLLGRRVADHETPLLGGAQKRACQQSPVDARSAPAVDRALHLRERRKQHLGLVRPDLGIAVIFGRAPAAHTGDDLAEMRDLVRVNRDGQRSARVEPGIACAILAQIVDQNRIVRGGARLEALDRIRVIGVGGGRENAGASIGRAADVAAIDQQRPHSGAHQMVGGGCADHAATDHDRIVSRHKGKSALDSGTANGSRSGRARRD